MLPSLRVSALYFSFNEERYDNLLFYRKFGWENKECNSNILFFSFATEDNGDHWNFKMNVYKK